MAENIYELFPLLPHHIFYPAHLCVVQNKSLQEGWAERGRKQLKEWVPVKRLGRGWSQVSGSPGLRLYLLWSEGYPILLLRGSLWEGRFQMRTLKDYHLLVALVSLPSPSLLPERSTPVLS